MARFFILSINYAPEPTGFAPHAAALADYLAHRGHEVCVFTGFPFSPGWRRRTEDRGRLFLRQRTGNLTLHRVTHYIPRRPSSVAQRLAMEGSFSVAACAAMVASIARDGRPDAILYIGAQPALAMLARIVSTLVRCPYFVNVTDLAGSAALDLGMVGRRVYRVLEAFEFAAYRGAAGASVLTRSFEDALVRHGYPRDRIRLVRSPVDLEHIRPVPRDGSFRARYGIPDGAFVILQAGSMGRKQGLMNVVSAAALSREAGICWVLVGDGETRQELVDAAAAQRLQDVLRFVPFQADADMSPMFADADVLLLNQVDAVKDSVIPSKLLMYMAAGRCVLATVNAHSQAAEILREADGGIIVPSERPDALAAGANELRSAPRHVLEAYGPRNRTYAEAHFDQRTILAAHEDLMLSVMAGAHRSSD